MRRWKGAILRPLEPAKEKVLPLVAFDCENDIKTGEMTHAAVYGEVINHHGKRIKLVPFYTDDQYKLATHIGDLARTQRFILVGFNI